MPVQSSGEAGIRTLETLAGLPVFKTEMSFPEPSCPPTSYSSIADVLQRPLQRRADQAASNAEASGLTKNVTTKSSPPSLTHGVTCLGI